MKGHWADRAGGAKAQGHGKMHCQLDDQSPAGNYKELSTA